jgi:uncharacterized protein (DUF427 family)
MSKTRLIPDSKHPITVETSTDSVTVTAGDTIIADTDKTLTLREASYPAVTYVPLTAVDPKVLQRSTTESYCPFKGDASYYDVVTDDGVVKDAAWIYEKPYDAVAPIAGHLAFYPDRVDVAVNPAS